MLTGAVEHWIGNAAAVLSGAWGAVTRRAEHSGYSRTTLYFDCLFGLTDVKL